MQQQTCSKTVGGYRDGRLLRQAASLCRYHRRGPLEDGVPVSSGTVILLNGASSAGKSSIARAVQHLLAEPYLHVALDHFLAMLPPSSFGVGPPFTPEARDGFAWVRPPLGAEERGIVIEAGPLGQQLLRGSHAAVVALATAGMNLIVDDVLLAPALLEHWLAVLAGIPTLFVGVHCPLAENERRERERGDREVGQARGQFAVVHAHQDYDVEVDTAREAPEACARRILLASSAAHDQTGNAFARLRRRRSAV
jgi:chloramphenicol 3-O phosphotransferase